MVACPVCLGSKVSPITGDTCKCCNGVGEITNDVAAAKARIRADLSSRLTQACSLTAGTRPFTRTHRYWNCPDIKNGPSNLSTSWENVDCPHCLVTGGQVSPFVTSGN